MRHQHGLKRSRPRSSRDRYTNWKDRAAFALLLLLVLASPFLYGLHPDNSRRAMGGGVGTPTGTTLLEVASFLIAFLTLLSRSPVSSSRALALPTSAAGALAGLGAFQLLRLPEGFLRLIAPANLQIYHETGEILSAHGIQHLPHPRVSIAPSETAQVILLLATAVSIFLSTAAVVRNRKRRRLFAAALFATSLCQIVLATVLDSPRTRIRGPFLNPDLFSTYLEITLAVAFGTLWAEILTNRERASEAPPTKAALFERRFPPLAVRVLLWAVTAGGIALTQSRGGIIAAGTTTLILLVSAIAHRRGRLDRRARAGAVLAILAGVAIAAAAAGASRFSRLIESDPRDLAATARPVLWKTSLAAWRKFPVVGSGLGTFREAFRRVQPRDLQIMVEHAHNQFLQLLVTGGILGATLGVVLFGSLFVLLFRAWQRQMHREESAVILAGFGALLSLTLHGLVDFGLSVPAISATLAAVLGYSWGAGRVEARSIEASVRRELLPSSRH